MISNCNMRQQIINNFNKKEQIIHNESKRKNHNYIFIARRGSSFLRAPASRPRGGIPGASRLRLTREARPGKASSASSAATRDPRGRPWGAVAIAELRSE